jgi:hypothetical protein
LILNDDLPREMVNIHSALAKNVDAVMPIQYSSFRPCFQTTLLSRH